MSEEDVYELWLERATCRLGFKQLAAILPGDLSPSYAYVFFVVGVIIPVLNIYTYLSGGKIPYTTNPFYILQPVALVGAVYGSHALHRRYLQVMQEMNIEQRASDPEALINIVPARLPVIFFLFGAVFTLVRSGVVIGFDEIYRTAGVRGLFDWIVMFAFVYPPIVAQFLAVFLSIELLAPLRLSRSDVGIHFLDPEGLGGLRPIGELIKYAYYYLVVGLFAFLLVMYGPALATPEWNTSEFAGIAFTFVWVLTIVVVGIAVFTLHRFMHREKRAEKRRLETELDKLTQNRWDLREYQVPDEDRGRVEELQGQLEKVSQTREYPATFNMWSQLLLSIFIPKAIQLVLASL